MMASTWNQKNTWGRAKLPKKAKESVVLNSFVSFQNHPLNVTLNSVPSSKILCIFYRKMWVFPKA